jgi:hypothetical protein
MKDVFEYKKEIEDAFNESRDYSVLYPITRNIDTKEEIENFAEAYILVMKDLIIERASSTGNPIKGKLGLEEEAKHLALDNLFTMRYLGCVNSNQYELWGRSAMKVCGK